MGKQYYIYILASDKNGTLYIGTTSDLLRRNYEHKNRLIPSFTQKYKIHRLIYFEVADNPTAAITREKQLKKWNRQWKIRLIEQSNPDWRDLSENFWFFLSGFPPTREWQFRSGWQAIRPWIKTFWSHLRDSNSGPLLYESIALPAELRWLGRDAEIRTRDLTPPRRAP